MQRSRPSASFTSTESPTTTSLVFGPVPSRRLGRSLGINNVPPKSCSYSCVYCQVGPTTHPTAERLECYDPEIVDSEVARRLRELAERHAGGRIVGLGGGVLAPLFTVGLFAAVIASVMCVCCSFGWFGFVYFGELGKLEVFSGVREYPVRVKCATLAWHTLHAAMEGEDESVTTE